MAARPCFCGCGGEVPSKLRRFNRQGADATKVQARLVEKALPILEEQRTDHRLLRFVEETDKLAREGARYVDDLRAIVHEEAPPKTVPGFADWRRAARERGDTIVIGAEEAARGD
ncbi:MAG: hypothetical protein H0V81_13165 [Solirubrobacterales bacterium]|nr:hypothetical protein [Solirubrobacterales bacterium]